MPDRRAAAYIAEFLGTLLLVFFIGVVVVQQGPISDFAAIGLVHTFVLAMLIFTLGPISGGHFNPAVPPGSSRSARSPRRRGHLCRDAGGRRHRRGAAGRLADHRHAERLARVRPGRRNRAQGGVGGRRRARVDRNLRAGLCDHRPRREPEGSGRLGRARHRRNARHGRHGDRPAHRRRLQPGSVARPGDHRELVLGRRASSSSSICWLRSSAACWRPSRTGCWPICARSRRSRRARSATRAARGGVSRTGPRRGCAATPPRPGRPAPGRARRAR